MEAPPLDALPDLPLHTVLAHLDAGSLREARAVSRGLRDAASDDALWAGALRHNYGDAAAAYVLGPSFSALRSNWARHAAWTVVGRRAGSQARCKLEVASTAARVNRGPVFCVASLGDGAFVTAGGGPDITIVRREPSAPVDVRAAHTNATSAFTIVASAPLPNPAALAVDGEWDGHEEGMLGMSYDPGSGTLVAGSFGGRLRAWRLNYAELRRLESLPAKRLRAILVAKGVPTDDIHERSEYLERIRTYRALPLAVPLAPSFDATHGHVSSVVGVSHSGDVVVTGANDGHARVWRLSTGKCVSSLGHTGPPLPPPADVAGGFQTAESVDSVLYTPATGMAYTGDKGGHVRAYDMATSQQTGHWDVPEAPWVWCIRDTAAADVSLEADSSGGGAKAGSSGSGGGLDGHRVLLVGCTDGVLRLADPRERGFAKAVPNGGVAASFGDANRLPVTGIALAPSFGRAAFVTSCFDGCVRIWDARALRPRVTLRGSHERLARIDVHHDLIAAGCMDGTVRMWDLRPERAADGGFAPHPLPSCNCGVCSVRPWSSGPHRRSTAGGGVCRRVRPEDTRGTADADAAAAAMDDDDDDDDDDAAGGGRGADGDDDGGVGTGGSGAGSGTRRSGGAAAAATSAAAAAGSDGEPLGPPHWPLCFYSGGDGSG